MKDNLAKARQTARNFTSEVKLEGASAQRAKRREDELAIQRIKEEETLKNAEKANKVRSEEIAMEERRKRSIE